MRPPVIVDDGRVDPRRVERVKRALLDEPEPVKCGLPVPARARGIPGVAEFCQAPYGHRGLCQFEKKEKGHG